MPKLNSLSDLYLEQLQDLHSGESQIIDALPKMKEAAVHPELKQAFETHLNQTKEQARRIEQICEGLGKSPKGEKCKGMEGIIEEGKEIMKMGGNDDVKDAALIAAAQRVEHYEIAGYGCAKTYARMLNRTEDLRLLEQTESEESSTDQLLTRLAETVINRDAFQGDRPVSRATTTDSATVGTTTTTRGTAGDEARRNL